MDVSFPRTVALQIINGTHPTITLVSDEVVDEVHQVQASHGTSTLRTSYIGHTPDVAWAGQLEVTFTIDD